MQFKTKLKASTQIIDMTPLVDVVFLLLIFFIVTSDILPLKSLNIENPIVSGNSTPLTTQIIVVMDAQNVIYLGSKKSIIELSSLEKNLLEEIALFKKINQQREPTIVLSVDKNALYDDFLPLFATIQRCCKRIRLVYRAEEPYYEEFF